jgi:L-lactate dehydrogenase complex protein LldE
VEAIVAPSGSCTTMTAHFYPVLFEDPAFAAERRRAESLAAVTFELTEFLVDVLGITRTGSRFDGTLTYHACCHLLRELHVDAQPRSLLANVERARLVELTGAEECCGFGGLFSVKNPGISTDMGRRKCINLEQSGADVVALCDVSCMTHINGLLDRQGQSVRAVHIAEILNNQVAPAVEENTAPPPPVIKPRRWQDV